MISLSIDTATENGMVVVARDDRVAAQVSWRSEGRHAENLFGFIESALADAGVSREEVSLIGASIGPGKFTSLRVGLATAKGLALGLGLPIVGVSSLRTVARSIEGDASLVRAAMMNAYRGEVFAAAYLLQDGVMKELVAPMSGPRDELLGRIRAAAGARPLATAEAATPEAFLSEVLYVHAAEGAADLALLEPQYLRPSDAKLPKRPLRTDHSS